jgi:hypothetical protein
MDSYITYDKEGAKKKVIEKQNRGEVHICSLGLWNIHVVGGKS